MAHVGSVTPAYGRDYKTEEAAIKDWKDGKDFIYKNITSPYHGRYCSCRDFAAEDTLQLRYDKNQEVVVVNGVKP